MTVSDSPSGASATKSRSGLDLQSPEPSMRHVPLGTLIFRAGLLTSEQLEEALQEAGRGRRRLGEVLLHRRLIGERDLARLMAGQKGLPYLDLARVDIDPELAQLLPYELASNHQALAVGRDERGLIVAVADPTEEAELAVREQLKETVRLVVGARGEIALLLARANGMDLDTPEPPLAPVSTSESRAARDASPPAPTSAPVEALRPFARPTPHERASATRTTVSVRTADGERVQVGSFEAPEEARKAAEELIGEIGDASHPTWPFVAGRYIRPEAILSIDLVEERGKRETGDSVGRRRPG